MIEEKKRPLHPPLPREEWDRLKKEIDRARREKAGVKDNKKQSAYSRHNPYFDTAGGDPYFALALAIAEHRDE